MRTLIPLTTLGCYAQSSLVTVRCQGLEGVAAVSSRRHQFWEGFNDDMGGDTQSPERQDFVLGHTQQVGDSAGPPIIKVYNDLIALLSLFFPPYSQLSILHALLPSSSPQMQDKAVVSSVLQG